jgi:hypothetical protein
VTDDTAYLQAFLDRGETPPPGVYTISRPLTFLGGGGGIAAVTEGATGSSGTSPLGGGGGGASYPPDRIDTRPHARHVIDDALTDWRDQSGEDMPAWMYNPDTVKELARFIRDRLAAAGMVAPPK